MFHSFSMGCFVVSYPRSQEESNADADVYDQVNMKIGLLELLLNLLIHMIHDNMTSFFGNH